MPRFQTYESITPGATETFGSYEVTEAEILEFARKYDPQDFHLDHEAAKSSLFGGLCASGWHVTAITMKMMVANWKGEGHSLGSPGVDELRWLKPVFPGYVLSVRVTALEKRLLKSRPGIGVASFLQEVLNQKGEVVMSMKSSAFFPQEAAIPMLLQTLGQ